MTQRDAATYALELLRTRTHCENARSRILIAITKLPEPISKGQVEELVLGSKRPQPAAK